jgi:hypothetical protein
MDLTPITTPLIETAAAFLTLCAPILLTRAIAAFEARTNITLTQQQQDTLRAAEQTAVGLIQVEMTKGNLALADLDVNSPTVRKAVAYLDTTVPTALRAFGYSPDTMATKLVGLVGKSLAADPTVATVAPKPNLPLSS